jgi:copper ion binding protein
MERVTMQVEGMSCMHCVKAVREALVDLEGVEVERVEVGAVTVGLDPARASRATVAEAVRDAGYEVVDA